MRVILLCLAVASVVSALQLTAPALDHVGITLHNRNHQAAGWVAGVNEKFVDMTIADAKKLLGVLPGGPKLPLKDEILTEEQIAAIPTEWDARKVWGARCPSTTEVRDQANCGSCWAFGAVSAMTDRICINTNGTKQVHISAEDMNSCCDSCGFGCDGGFPGAAWQYWQDSGVVDGANYKVQPSGCYPYSIANCDHHLNQTGKYGPCPPIQDTPTCTSQCVNGKQWSASKNKASRVYSVGSNPAQIQTEIMTYGPVEADFTVYQDFLSYKSGVYKHSWGDELGGHAIKILGWGVDGTTPYWIVANSWNDDWGQKGYFNILRGRNECGIEDDINAGLP